MNSELRTVTSVCAQVKTSEINNLVNLTLGNVPEIQIFFFYT